MDNTPCAGPDVTVPGGLTTFTYVLYFAAYKSRFAFDELWFVSCGSVGHATAKLHDGTDRREWHAVRGPREPIASPL